jgi:hypothetical protein
MNNQDQNSVSRRALLKAAVPAGLAAAFLPRVAPAAQAGGGQDKLPPVRAITRGPKHHWFGYYDKRLFDPTGRYVLGMEVDFEHRSPKPDDVIKVGMVDLQDHDRWIELGQSTAWCWQQGCMLQWRPGSQSEVIWNDRQGDAYVCRLLDVKTGKRRTLPHPIYALSPDGRWAVATDFRRLGDMRPGYGYNGIPDPSVDVLAPKDSGVWRLDLETGRHDLIVPLAEMPKIPFPHGDISKAKHWFNHLLVSPDGRRVEFLNRWKSPGSGGHRTRMLTVAPDGSDLQILDDNGVTSHFIWRDPRHILAWSTYQRPGGFFLFEDKTHGKVASVLTTGDGHCTYLPGDRWILADTYPDKNRNQNIYLYDPAAKRRVWLGHFLSPKAYTGEWRCDTHPSCSPDGRAVLFESPHTGEGRQMHLIDISEIVG